MLHLHCAQRSDALARDLAARLAVAPSDAFTREVVAVPTKGVERWLAQRLSHVLGSGSEEGADGVCALVDFPSPARLVAQALAVAQGFDADTDPWRPAALTWSVLQVVDASLDEAWAAPLRRHLGGTGTGGGDGSSWRRGRRFSLASKAAGLLSAYADERPSMVLGWLDGRDDDGAGSQVPDDLRWQPELLRAVRRHLDVPGPAERLAPACQRVVADPAVLALPDRLSVFGPTRLSTSQLLVLQAMAQEREVHLWLPHPSPALWEQVAGLGPAPMPLRRRDDPAREQARHPLLRSLARDARELQQRLAQLAPGPARWSEPATAPASNLLGRLQTALAADEPPAGTRPAHQPGDLSLEVHSCHGRARQVEVLREVLLHRLQADPTLEPRDILVMCPQIEVFAPLLSAVLGLADQRPGGAASEGASEGHPGQQLRVSLADRSLRQTNDVLAVLDRVLALAAGRVPVSAVRDLVSLPPVRRRFGLDTSDVELIEAWVEAAAVRWGLDPDHRRRSGLGAVGQGTWQVGLDRLVLGIAASEHDGAQIGHALPLDGVDSKRAELAGRFAELVQRLGDIVRAMGEPRPLSRWLELLEQVLTGLCDTSSAESWMLVSARSALAEVAAAGDLEQTLTLPDVQSLLGELLAGRPTRTSFRTGSLTVCTMMPMRSVPHRVVVLLGLDEQSFPRAEGADGDDVLLREPWVGERDRRSEDRQLLCDALTAASDAVVVLYSGRDERTNAELAPSVPVAELLDTVDAMVDCGPGGARAAVVVQQPLQPFDPDCFVPGQHRPRVAFSHDSTALAGACAARGPRTPRPELLIRPLPVEALSLVELDDLLRWGDNPARELVRHRLGIGLVEADELPLDEVLVEMDGLAAWGVGDRLLTDRLRGLSEAEAAGTEWLRGLLPPGQLGDAVIQRQGKKVEQVVAAAAPWTALPADQLDVDLVLPSGRRLSGSIPVRGRTVLTASTSSLKAKVRWRAWVQLLTLAAARPELATDAVIIGGGSCVYLPPGPADALRRLDDAVELMAQSRSRRMPLPTATGYAYAVRALRLSPKLALDGARDEWWNQRYQRGESTDRFVAALWGTRQPVEVLLAGASADDPASELAQLSLRRWSDLLGWQRSELPQPVQA